MLITESARRFGYSPLRLLDQMEYLSEAEAVYDPAMVPVVESSEVGAYLVKVEDMVKFCESNGISDIGQGLYLVCESSGIDPSYVAFSVNQESLWESDMAELVADIMNEGVAVVGIPMNPYHPASLMVDAAVNEMLEYGSSVILESICYGEYDIFAESYEALGLLLEAEKNAGESTGNGSGESAPTNAKEAEKKADSFLDKVKHYAHKPIEWLKALMTKIHDYMQKVEFSARLAEQQGKGGIWNTIKMKLASALEVLTRYINNAGRDDDSAGRLASTSDVMDAFKSGVKKTNKAANRGVLNILNRGPIKVGDTEFSKFNDYRTALNKKN